MPQNRNRSIIPSGLLGGGLKPCAVPHCGQAIKDRWLMCAEHWGMVPADLKTAVAASWARMQGQIPLDELSIRVHAHERAAERAIDAVLVALEGGEVEDPR